MTSGTLEWVLAQQYRAALKETSDEAKKRAHRRFQDVVLTLSGEVWG